MDWVIVNYQKYGETFMVIEREIKKPRSRYKRAYRILKPYIPIILGFLLR